MHSLFTFGMVVGDLMDLDLLSKPILIFDGECGFCRRWIAKWRCTTGGRVRFRPYQKVAKRFPEIPKSQFETAIQLVEPDGRHSAGAEAVFRCLSYGKRAPWGLRAYLRSRLFRYASECAYKWVSAHRMLASRIMRRLKMI